MTDTELAEIITPSLTTKLLQLDKSLLLTIIGLVKNRMTFVHEFWEQASFFFFPPENYDEKSVKDKWKSNSAEHMKKIGEILLTIEPFNAQNAKPPVLNFIAENQLNTGMIMNALRLLIVGESKGPDLFALIEIIGKEQTLSRIEKGISALNS